MKPFNQKELKRKNLEKNPFWRFCLLNNQKFILILQMDRGKIISLKKEARMQNPDTQQQASAAPSVEKADLGKRFIAMLIDVLIAIVVGLIPVVGGFIGAAYLLLRDGFDYEFMDRRSVGKKLMKLRPVRMDNQPVDINTSIKRNWMFALGALIQALFFIPVLGWILIPVVGLASLVIGIVEIVLVITNPEGIRWGDKLGSTKVIEESEPVQA
ncbi:hypothetical protein GF406_24425 [candidate division KSB1 bacterium]|nr:hypothetical protein [candidate division KSB1 bacterium]